MSKKIKVTDFPPGFTELSLAKKISIAVKANSNNAVLNYIIAWLKDPEREHIQNEDETIIILLNSKVDALVAEGIRLPPPYIYDYFNYSKDFIHYLDKYSEVPSREATEQEKKDILSYILSRSSYVTEDVNALITYNMLPRMEDTAHHANILNALQKLNEDTVRKLLEHLFIRGDLKEIGQDQLIDFFTGKLQHWQQDKERFRIRNPLRTNSNYHRYIFNIGIQNYTIAKDFAIKLFRDEAIKEAREIHKLIETAEPDSQFQKLPINVAPKIVEFATGIKYNEYKGGKGGKRSRRVRRSKSKSNRRYTRKY